MQKGSIRYKDVWVSPGSDLFKALDAGDTKGAEEIYWIAQVEFRKYNAPNALQEALNKVEEIRLRKLLETEQATKEAAKSKKGNK